MFSSIRFFFPGRSAGGLLRSQNFSVSAQRGLAITVVQSAYWTRELKLNGNIGKYMLVQEEKPFGLFAFPLIASSVLGNLAFVGVQSPVYVTDHMTKEA